jgi:hypothetical protein
MLAVKYKKYGVTYHDAIDLWLKSQRTDVILVFVQFFGVALGSSPRVYLARPKEIADHMKTQHLGRGYGSLQENYRRKHPRSKYDHKVPDTWSFSKERLTEITR